MPRLAPRSALERLGQVVEQDQLGDGERLAPAAVRQRAEALGHLAAAEFALALKPYASAESIVDVIVEM